MKGSIRIEVNDEKMAVEMGFADDVFGGEAEKQQSKEMYIDDSRDAFDRAVKEMFANEG